MNLYIVVENDDRRITEKTFRALKAKISKHQNLVLRKHFAQIAGNAPLSTMMQIHCKILGPRPSIFLCDIGTICNLHALRKL